MGRLGRFVQGGIGIVLFVLVVWYFLGLDGTPPLPKAAVDSSGGMADSSAAAAAPGPGQELGKDPQGDFVASVLADTEDSWGAIFRAADTTYEPPKRVLFSGAVQSACGFAKAAMGPFYCADDRTVYLDLDFFSELRKRFPEAGDFAETYVIAHEIGHHVQNLMGNSDTARQLLETASADEATTISAIVELQADCYAGVWANHADRTRHILEQAGAEEALAAATTIGADRLQQQKSRGYVMPDSFTVGTPEQRLRWFLKGLTTGDVETCDTFTAEEL